MEITINYSDNIELEIGIDIEIIGRRIPATQYEPEEYPEFNFSIYAVWFKDKVIKNIRPINWTSIRELVEEKINDLDLEEIY